MIIEYDWAVNLEGYVTSNMYVSSSQSGQYIAAVSVTPQAGQPIYLSDNSGSTWTIVSSLTSTSAGGGIITVSGNGQYIVVTVGGTLYISNDYGGVGETQLISDMFIQ